MTAPGPYQQPPRYALLGLVGEGGFATVYRAWDAMLGREVALKALQPQLCADPEARRRFFTEVQAIAPLSHANIVTFHDAGELNGRPFYTMDLIEGQTLAETIAGGRFLPVPEVVTLIRRLASAIDYLHAAGIVHRDIKPANVMLDKTGRAVLMDFGIARLLESSGHTRPGAMLGTPEYMSPEQVQGHGEGPAADIYALGILAYQLLAGMPPFTGTYAHVLHAHVYDPPPPLSSRRPDLPPVFDAVLERALAKHPAQRYLTAIAFADALTAASRMLAPSVTDTVPLRPADMRAALADLGAPPPGSNPAAQAPLPQLAHPTSVHTPDVPPAEPAARPPAANTAPAPPPARVPVVPPTMPAARPAGPVSGQPPVLAPAAPQEANRPALPETVALPAARTPADDTVAAILAHPNAPLPASGPAPSPISATVRLPSQAPRAHRDAGPAQAPVPLDEGAPPTRAAAAGVPLGDVPAPAPGPRDAAPPSPPVGDDLPLSVGAVIAEARPRRRRWPLVLGAVATVLLAVVLGAAFVFGGGATPQGGVAAGTAAAPVASASAAGSATPEASATPAPAPRPAAVAELVVYDNAFDGRRDRFLAGETLYVCFQVTPGSEPRGLTLVAVTGEAPAERPDSEAVARLEGVRQEPAGVCEVTPVHSPPLAPGTYTLAVFEGAARLAVAGFEVLPPPTPEPPPPPTPSPAVVAPPPPTVVRTAVPPPPQTQTPATPPPTPRQTAAPPTPPVVTRTPPPATGSVATATPPATPGVVTRTPATPPPR